MSLNPDDHCNHAVFYNYNSLLYIKAHFRWGPASPIWTRFVTFFWVLHPRLKDVGPIYGSHPIGMLYFIFGPWILDPHVKWA